MARFFSFLRFFVLLQLALAPAEAIQAFKPESSTRGQRPYYPIVAHGDSWTAYRPNDLTIEVADRSTRQVILKLQPPADNSAVEGKPNYYRTLGYFGKALAADGNRLATICDSRVEHSEPGILHGVSFGLTVFMWDVPSGRLIGAADLEISQDSGTPFIGLSNGKLLVADSFKRKLWLWNAEDMASLPALAIPEGFDPPEPISYSDAARAGMAGNHFVYCATSPALVAVNLATRQYVGLPVPEDTYLNRDSRIAINRQSLLCACRPLLSTGVLSGDFHLLHYNLQTSEPTATTRVAGGDHGYSGLVPMFAGEGHWHALANGTDGTQIMVSGNSTVPAGSPESSLVLPTFGRDIGRAFACVDGDIWFYPTSSSLPGVVAYRLPVEGIPSTLLTANCLPCHEADGVLKVSIKASPASQTPISFHLRTEDGTAKATDDYTTVDKIVTLAAGATEAIIEIPLIRDQTIEASESLFVTISEASGNALILEPRIPGVIGASSFNLLPPVATFKGGPNCYPTGVAVAGGRLLQMNLNGYSPSSTIPAIVSRPFDSGEWQASTGWGRPVPIGTSEVQYLGNKNGLALLREPQTVSVYDAAADQVVFRKTGQLVNYGRDAISDTHLVTQIGTDKATEYSLAPPYDSRKLTMPDQWISLRGAAYVRDYLILTAEPDSLELFSRADGTHVGTLLANGPWSGSPRLIAEDNLLVISSESHVWTCDLDGSRELEELRPASGSFTGVLCVEMLNGNIFVQERRDDGLCIIRVFERSTGVEIATLLTDLQATRLPGDLPLPPPYQLQSIPISPLAIEGRNAAVLFARNSKSYVIRFSQGSSLPSLVRPEPIREGDGELRLSLTEASGWPLTITTRAIASGNNDQEDWGNSGATVTIPAGVTSFNTGISMVDDHLPEDPLTAPIEVTITGNGITETYRTSVDITDNDVIAMEEVSWITTTMGRIFTPLGEGWAYRSFTDSGEYAVAWSEDLSFRQGSPVGFAGRWAFANAMAGSEGWLAVAHDHYGEIPKKPSPSRIYIYRPGERRTPVRIIKGQKYTNRFASELFARKTSLWVGAPGLEGVINGGKSAGKAYQYNMATGKLIRTYKAQKGLAMGFGSTITANDTSIWIASPTVNGGSGVVSQYSQSKGKLIRVIPSPRPGTSLNFGSEMIATHDQLIVGNMDLVRGYSEATGQVVWTLQSPREDEVFGIAMALLPGNILAVAGRNIYFYHLAAGEVPQLIVELQAPAYNSVGIDEMQVNGYMLATQEGGFTEQRPGKMFDLRAIPQLQPFLSTSPPISKLVATDAPEKEEMTLTFTEGSWLLTLPPLPVQPGGPALRTVLESSLDLDIWTPVALFAEPDTWVLFDESGGGVALPPGERSFRFPAGPAARFFRISVSPETP